MDLVKPAVFRVEITGQVVNLPNPVADSLIVRAMRDFTDRVALWQTTATVSADNGVLDLAGIEDDNQDVVRVMPGGVRQAGTVVPEAIKPGPGYFVADRRRLEVGDNGDYQVTVQLRSALFATQVPGAILRDYHEAIIDNALYRAYRMPFATWAKPDLSNMYYQRFITAAMAARNQVPRHER